MRVTPRPRTRLPAVRSGGAAYRLVPWVLGFLAYWVAYAGAYRVARPDVGWALALRGAAFTIWPEVVLAPAVFLLVRRLSWDGPRGRIVLFHLAGAVLFTILSLAGTVAAFAVEVRRETGSWSWPTPVAILVWRAVMTLLVYCALCSIGHAAAFARRVRAEAERAARAETLRAQALPPPFPQHWGSRERTTDSEGRGEPASPRAA